MPATTFTKKSKDTTKVKSVTVAEALVMKARAKKTLGLARKNAEKIADLERKKAAQNKAVDNKRPITKVNYGKIKVAKKKPTTEKGKGGKGGKGGNKSKVAKKKSTVEKRKGGKKK